MFFAFGHFCSGFYLITLFHVSPSYFTAYMLIHNIPTSELKITTPTQASTISLARYSICFGIMLSL
jgi:hypothetical protein